MSSPDSNPEPHIQRELVVLVHGIWCMAVVMWFLAWRLQKEGYRTRCLSYASVFGKFDTNVDNIVNKIAGLDEPVVHLVAHSFGGLILTSVLDRGEVPPGRFVLLGSPVRGARLAAGVLSGRFRRHLLGRAMQSPLVTGLPDEMLQRISGKRAVGVVSGTTNKTLLGLIFGRLDSGDGLVASGETRFPGAEHTELPETHAGMLFSAPVANNVAQFLQTGCFSDQAAEHRQQ